MCLIWRFWTAGTWLQGIYKIPKNISRADHLNMFLTPSWFRKLPIGHNGRSYFILIILKGEKSIDFIKGYWFVNQRALETHKLFPIFHIVLICIVAFVGQISLIVAKDVFFFFLRWKSLIPLAKMQWRCCII